MMLLFLLLFYPRTLPLKCVQNQGRNRLIVTFAVAVVIVVVIVVVVIVVVVIVVVFVVVHVVVVLIDPTNLPFKFG